MPSIRPTTLYAFDVGPGSEGPFNFWPKLLNASALPRPTSPAWRANPKIPTSGSRLGRSRKIDADCGPGNRRRRFSRSALTPLPSAEYARLSPCRGRARHRGRVQSRSRQMTASGTAGATEPRRHAVRLSSRSKRPTGSSPATVIGSSRAIPLICTSQRTDTMNFDRSLPRRELFRRKAVALACFGQTDFAGPYTVYHCGFAVRRPANRIARRQFQIQHFRHTPGFAPQNGPLPRPETGPVG